MGLLDISGFFTGLIINLLLITLVCYYFKRKYENIEAAQMEQAKVLYELLQKNHAPEVQQVYEQPVEYSDDESSVESDDGLEDLNELIVEEIKQEHDDEDYNKLSVKSLRDLLSEKGIKTTPKMKKNQLISLVTDKKSLVVDLAFEENSDEVQEEEPVLSEVQENNL